MRQAIAIFLLFTATAWGAIDTVHTLPFTVTTDYVNDTLILVQGSDGDTTLTSSTGIMTFDANVHDLLIDLREDTILWNQGNNASQGGFYSLDGTNYNITFHGGFVIEDLTPDNAFQVGSNTFAVGESHDLLLDSMYIKVVGHSSQIWYNPDSDGEEEYNIEMRGCLWDNARTAQLNRDIWIDMAMIATGNHNRTNMSGFQYHYKITACSTIASNWVNYYLAGDSTVAIIDSCYIFVDANNTSTISCSGVTCSAEQCYGIGLRWGGANVQGCRIKVFDNTFRTGTAHAGGNAIFITAQGMNTTSDSCIEIYNNDVICRKGNAGFGGGGYNTSATFRFRTTFYGVYVHDNTIEAWADSSDATDYMTENVTVFRIEEDTMTAYGSNRLRIENNRIFAGWSGTQYAPILGADPDRYTVAFEFSGIDSGVAKNYVIKNNYIESGAYAIIWSNDNADPEMVRQMTAEADTFVVHDSVMSSVALLGIRVPDTDDNNNNIFLDCQFDTTNGMDMSDIATNGSPTYSFYAKNTLTMVVVQDGSPLQNAACSVWNAYSQQAGAGTSDVNGEYSVAVIYAKYTEGADSTAYNDFTLKAISGTDSAMTTYTISYDDKLDTLTLPASTPTPLHGRFRQP